MLNWQGLENYGFAPFSRCFLQNYKKINISMEEAMLVMHLLDHVWLGKESFPTVKLFANVTGKSEQTIRMYFRSLRFKGFLKVTAGVDARTVEYDYSPLITALKSIAKVPMVEQTTVQEKAKSELEKLVDANNELAIDKSLTRVPVTTKSSHWKRIESFINKSVDEYNSKDIELLLASEWKKKGWKSAPPRFYKKDLKHGAELIKIYGASDVAKVVTQSVENWENIAPKFNIRGYPNMGIFWGFRNSIFPMIIDGDLQNNNPSWGSHYQQEQTKKGQEVGW
jgi:hypothetical protein